MDDTGRGRAAIVPRDARIVSYSGGVRTVASELLMEIEMWAPNPIESEKVRSYKLQYRESASTRRALLASVRERDAANICKPATSFDYSPSNPEWERIPTTISVTNILEGGSGFSAYQDTAAARIFVGDLDGDGRDDVMYRRYNSTLRRYQPYYHSSNGRGFSTLNVIEVEELQPTAQNITDVDSLIDIDADGKMELGLLRNTHTPDHCVLQPTAETFRFRCPINASLALEGGSAPSFSLYADLNGDGFPEKVRTHDDLFFHARINTRGVLGPYVPFMTDNFTGEFFGATHPFFGVRPVDLTATVETRSSCSRGAIERCPTGSSTPTGICGKAPPTSPKTHSGGPTPISTSTATAKRTFCSTLRRTASSAPSGWPCR